VGNVFVVLLIILGLIGFWGYSRSQDTNPSLVTEKSISEENVPEKVGEEKHISPISIEYLRNLKIEPTEIQIEEKLNNGSNYQRFLVSYKSEGYKIYALLTIPFGETPEGGFPAIIFNHGYIPPKEYRTLERYVAYVDYLARSGFIVMKIDMRGHGNSEGVATGSYFSNTYTIDVLSALEGLKKFEQVNKNKIGLWGHSMSGNLILRSMLVNPDFKAGVIWAGAVYSYEDFSRLGLSDSSFVRRTQMTREVMDSPNREKSPEVQKLRENPKEVNFESDFWKSISLTQNLDYLNAPIQIHHAVNDNVVNIEYSRELKKSLDKESKDSEFYEYSGGGHNIESPYFEIAMRRTVEFFKEHLK